MEKVSTVRTTSLWLGRLLLAVVFGYAAVSKIAQPDDFAEAVSHYRILGPLSSAIAAMFLPWLEVVVAVALFVPRFRLGSASLALLLNGLFLGATTWAWANDLNIDCGCFGTGSAPTAMGASILRNVGLLLTGAFLVWDAVSTAPPGKADAGQATARAETP